MFAELVAIPRTPACRLVSPDVHESLPAVKLHRSEEKRVGPQSPYSTKLLQKILLETSSKPSHNYGAPAGQSDYLGISAAKGLCKEGRSASNAYPCRKHVA
ncbi:hypothetical protein SBBP2_1550014 [Burkholderiales bacterium]|nr:hypothetical protein SBBP2_1550014 [Burkholderiales bacterium]